jgi:hypothetical protein
MRPWRLAARLSGLILKSEVSDRKIVEGCVKVSKYLEQASQVLLEATKHASTNGTNRVFNQYLEVAKELARLAEIERGPIPTYVVLVSNPSLIDGKGPATLTISADGVFVGEDNARHSPRSSSS